MKKILLLTCCIFTALLLFPQSQNENVVYIVDSIPVLYNPAEDDVISEEDVSEVIVLKNRDSLKALGLEKYAGAIYLFTKAYRNRAPELKSIPSTRQMERKNDVLYFRGSPYNGRFIDYFLSGRKHSEGTALNGKREGQYTSFYQNGQVLAECYYKNGIENGSEIEFYEDGTLKQKGEFVNGLEEGVWEMYFPNGQLKQSNSFTAGKMEGTSTVYYSTGKVMAIEVIKNGKVTPDKRLEKISGILKKGHQSYEQGDIKSALKQYSKAIESDTTYAQAWAVRGTAYLNDMKFDAAIADLNKALQLEPYLEKALTNRAFARIRKHQLAGSRKIGGGEGVTVMAGKDNPGIPASELTLICSDLKKAISLGDKGKMILDAYNEFCGANKN
jgi:tetratricopeptide (TPR) repeat protein